MYNIPIVLLPGPQAGIARAKERLDKLTTGGRGLLLVQMLLVALDNVLAQLAATPGGIGFRPMLQVNPARLEQLLGSLKGVQTEVTTLVDGVKFNLDQTRAYAGGELVTRTRDLFETMDLALQAGTGQSALQRVQSLRDWIGRLPENNPRRARLLGTDLNGLTRTLGNVSEIVRTAREVIAG